jgi:hypothetical protein
VILRIHPAGVYRVRPFEAPIEAPEVAL